MAKGARIVSPLWDDLNVGHLITIPRGIKTYTTQDLQTFSKDVSNVAGMYLTDNTGRRDIIIFGRCEEHPIHGYIFFAGMGYTPRANNQLILIQYQDPQSVCVSEEVKPEEIAQGGLEQVAHTLRQEIENQTLQTITNQGQFPLKNAKLSDIRERLLHQKEVIITLREA